MSHFLEMCTVVLALLLASNLWFLQRVLNPLRQLCVQAKQLAQGDFDSFEQPSGGIPEVESLRRTMAGMVRHVRRAQEHSYVYAEVLANGQEAERARIARDLHDQTVQSLVAIGQSIEMAQKWIETDPTRASSMLKAARAQSLETISELRDLIGDLRPPALDELGLVAALELQADRYASLPVTIKVEGIEHRLPETHELALFRSVQEALINACRHSHATKVDIKVIYESAGIRLTITDNGMGFTPPNHFDDLIANEHYGLLGIHERIQQLDGKVKITSEKSVGTTVDIYLPADNLHQPEDTVRDPVCSAVIEPNQAYGNTVYEGQTYYFCCPVCQGAFQREPETYLEPEFAVQ